MARTPIGVRTPRRFTIDLWTRLTACLKYVGRQSWTETALALSGGGQDGAFGAGLLVGWTKRGECPNFDYVTGVSAGALLAPIAFLGPDYDARLRDLFTTVDEDSLLRERWFGAALTEDAVLTPLRFSRKSSPSSIRKGRRASRANTPMGGSC